MGNWFFPQWQISRTWFQTELKLPNAFCAVWEQLCCIGHFWRPSCPVIQGYRLIADIFGESQADTENEWRQGVWRRGQGRRSSSYTSSSGLAAPSGSKWSALCQVSPYYYLFYLHVCSPKIKEVKFVPLRKQNIVTDSSSNKFK